MTPAACECGNSGAHEGFYSCDGLGRPVGAGSLRCCQRCGRITEAGSGKLVGHRSFALTPDFDASDNGIPE